jgi:DNA-binding transcriptional LysR family regulator
MAVVETTTTGQGAGLEVAGRGLESPPKPRLPRPESVRGPSLNRLHCFEVVVEEAGFKRATARLHITQPALSYQIKQLEEELDVQLFYRRPGGVSATEAGRLLFQHAQQVSAAVRQAWRAMKELSEGTAGEIRIGTVNSIGIHFLPQLLWAMRERYPATRTTVLTREAGDIVDTLLSSQLDLAILAHPRADHRLRYETLFEERVSLVSGRGHRFFGRPTVRSEELEGERFVALSPQTPTGALIRDYLDRAGLPADPVISTHHVETVKRMVEIGMGIAFLPDMVTEREVTGESPSLARVWRSAVDPPLTRRIVLVTWDDAPESRAVAAFVDEVRRRSSARPGAAAKAKGG